MSSDFLDPLPLRPDPPPKPGRSNAGLWRMVLSALLLLLLGLGLITWLAHKTGSPGPEVHATPQPTTAPEPTATVDPSARLRAEAALDQVMEALHPLRSLSVELWGGQDWSNSVQEVKAGDEALARKDYDDATGAYQQALKSLGQVQRLQSSAPSRLMARAEAAYARGNADTAVAGLSALLRLEPGNTAAHALLPRARNAGETFAALASAKQKRADGDTARAWVDAERAQALDPDFPGLSALRSELSAILSNQEFSRWISEGLQALSAGDLDAAEPLVRRAASFKPDHPAVKDALARLEDARRQQKVLRLRREAEAFETAGDWRLAYERYLDILSLDASAPFSLAGRERTSTWLLWEEKIKRASSLLTSSAAADLQKELSSQTLDAWPTTLRTQAETFLKQWTLIHTPVPVQFRSDAETTVLITNVARWEPFIDKNFAILPGTYVAKGSRLGYRDVRVSFTVPPGGPGGVVEIRCVEGIH